MTHEEKEESEVIEDLKKEKEESEVIEDLKKEKEEFQEKKTKEESEEIEYIIPLEYEDPNYYSFAIHNSINGIDEAIEYLKKIKHDTLNDSKNINLPILEFLQDNYLIDANNFTSAYNLWNEYKRVSGNENISKKKLGNMMTDFIKSENNIYSIDRIRMKGTVGYIGLKMFV
jgi:hypothetical protein